KAYSKIATKIKDDPELIIKIADTLAHTAARDLDTEDFRKSRGYYYTALDTGPQYLPAHYRVIEDLSTAIRYGARRSTDFDEARSRATDLLALEPDYLPAKRLYAYATAQEQVIAPDDVAPDELEQAKAFMQEMIADGYALDGESVQWLTQISAAGALRNSRVMPELTEQALSEINRLTSALEEEAGDNALRWFYAATAASTAVQVAEGDARQDWLDRRTDAIRKAGELASASGESDLLMKIVPTYAQLAAGQGLQEEAEALLRQLVETRPWDLLARQLLAEFLGDRKRLDEAIAVLEEERPEGPIQPGQDGLAVRSHEAQTTLLRAIYRLERIKALPQAERAEPLDEVRELAKEYEGQWRRLTDVPTENSPGLLQIRGMIQVAENDHARGINNLMRADALISPNDRIRKLKLWFELAEANLAIRQTGPARKYLEQILQYNPAFMPARATLASVHIQERRFDAAREQVEALIENDPDNPRYQQLAVLALGDRAAEAYEDLPESKPREIGIKRQSALQLGMTDEANRLLAKLAEMQPNNPSVAWAHARVLAGAGDVDGAIAVLQFALADPTPGIDATRAEQLLKRLEAGSVEQYIAENASEYQKKLYEYEVAMLRGDTEGADLALDEAEKLAPEGN
ncbi:MAG: tetratricopeptide repeat protein, partial [Planctomycetota bacterium]